MLILSASACNLDQERDGASSAPERSVVAGAVQQEVRDSADTRIVTYATRPATAASWGVRWSEAVRLGWNHDGMATGAFGRTVGAVRFDGGIAVGDAFLPGIRLFDVSGSLRTTLGRGGDGPGELHDLTGVFVLSSDTVVAVASAFALTTFTPAGFGASYRIDPLRIGGDRFPQIIGVFADGSLLASLRDEETRPDVPVNTIRSRTRYYRASRSGDVLSDFGALPSAPLVFLPFEETTSEQNRVNRATPGPLALAQGDRFYWASPTMDEARVYGPSGGVETILRFNWEPAEAPDFRFYRSSAGVEQGATRRRLEAELEHAGGPGPFVGFAVDDGGGMWLRLGDEGDEGGFATWIVFSAAGEPMASVRLPYWWGFAGTDMKVHEDGILAFEEGELGENQYVWVPLDR
jgi:hypothetical protein